MSALTLKIVTPEGVDKTVDCDSVTLWMAPDASGEGEGSIGILKGHADALIALGKGPTEARLKGVPVFSALTDEGFATVSSDTVTVVTHHADIRSH